MRPLRGTEEQAASARVIGFCLARGRPKAGENPSLTLASDACRLPTNEAAWGGFPPKWNSQNYGMDSLRTRTLSRLRNIAMSTVN